MDRSNRAGRRAEVPPQLHELDLRMTTAQTVGGPVVGRVVDDDDGNVPVQGAKPLERRLQFDRSVAGRDDNRHLVAFTA
jgi:hypothetical protein